MYLFIQIACGKFQKRVLGERNCFITSALAVIPLHNQSVRGPLEEKTAVSIVSPIRAAKVLILEFEGSLRVMYRHKKSGFRVKRVTL